ncbi:Ig-like domain-containing protein [Cohnella sp. GCM10012308]|uniref:Ig-like domain-containing protein n=1 Tax=Cohnella sp. GCM10012308 TaxID=3317329 RepID=UPI00360FD9A6
MQVRSGIASGFGIRRATTFALCIALLAGVWYWGPSTAYAATDYYVSPAGSNSNPGTQAQPFLTILKASQTAAPGSTIHVAPGTYEGGFRTSASGTETARIRYVSEVKWGARIVPPVDNPSKVVWDNQGSYVDIEGFEIDGNGTATLNGILTEGSFTAVRGNHVHDIASAVPCTSQGGAGINTDYYYYGVGTEISGNVVHNIGFAGCSYIQGIYVSTSGTVSDNLVYQIGGAAVHLWHDANTVTISNNTLFSSWFGIVVGGGDYYHTQGPADQIHVSNNIVYDNTYGISEQGSTGPGNTYTNNLVYQNATYNLSLQNGLTDTGTVSADPQFVYYAAAGGGDYRLKASSPAIDAGDPVYATAADLDGHPRPVGAAVDLGAYEYTGAFEITALAKTLKAGETTQILSASDLSGATFASDRPDIATVDGSGLVTAVANGEAVITATMAEPGEARTATLRIKVAEHLETVSLQTSETETEVGQTRQFSVAGLMSDGAPADLGAAAVRYYMSGRTVATVNSAGLVTGLAAGTDTLNVDVTLDGVTKSSRTALTIAPPTLASVTLSLSRDTLIRGQTAQAAAAGVSPNGKATSMKNATIAYRSANPSVATVSASGLITAVAPGTALIGADVTLSGKTVSAERTITVQPGAAFLFGFAKLPVVEKTANTILYNPTLQFEAVTEGPRITFGLEVPETHLYQVRLRTFKATSYGKYTILLDGQPLANYDFYGSTGAGTAFDPIGSAQLASGTHQLTFANVGKRDEATNYKMGVIELELLALPDQTAPVTGAALSGTAGTDGWYKSSVQVALTADDGDTGVAATEYRLNSRGTWRLYTAPLALSADGVYAIEYRSLDAAGNVERAKALKVKIDRTAPRLTVRLDRTVLWPPNGKMIAIHAYVNKNDAGSGIADVRLTSVTSSDPGGADDIRARIGSADNVFSVRAEKSGGGKARIYTVTYTVTDRAGNQASASATVTVPRSQSGH